MHVNDEIMWFIRRNPGHTATQLAKQFGKRVDSLSSFLAKKVNAGVLARTDGGGPRGGYTYAWADSQDKFAKAKDKTLWQRLMEED